MTTPRRNEMARRLLALFAALMALTFGIAVNASAAPPVDGCPQGWELISVAQAEAEGRPPARVVDEFAGHPAGNRDGYVCRRALGDGIDQNLPGRPDTIYRWRDNRQV
jgi:hypothetical protein